MNFLCQVFGRKEVVLFAPTPANEAVLRPFSSTLHPHLRNTSMLDLADAKVLEENPDLQKASWSHVILRPGEALFIPKGWWHFVRSLDPSLSVNFWWTHRFKATAKRS